MVAMANAKSLPFAYRLSRWRRWVQGVFLLAWLDPLALRLHTICGPVFHCHSCPLATFACPIGVLANFSALHVFPFVAVGVLVIAAGLLGSFICGWLCPFGFLQDLAGRIPTPRFRLPRWSGYLRYAVLAGLVFAIPFFLGGDQLLFFCRLCPAGGLEAAVPVAVRQAMAGQKVALPGTVKIVIVSVLVVSMLFTWRPWCRLFCPLGAIYGISNRVSFAGLRFNPDKCDACGRCDGLCRYGASPPAASKDPACIRCLECTRCGAITVTAALGAAQRPAAPRQGTD